MSFYQKIKALKFIISIVDKAKRVVLERLLGQLRNLSGRELSNTPSILFPFTNSRLSAWHEWLVYAQLFQWRNATSLFGWKICPPSGRWENGVSQKGVTLTRFDKLLGHVYSHLPLCSSPHTGKLLVSVVLPAGDSRQYRPAQHRETHFRSNGGCSSHSDIPLQCQIAASHLFAVRSYRVSLSWYVNIQSYGPTFDASQFSKSRVIFMQRIRCCVEWVCSSPEIVGLSPSTGETLLSIWKNLICIFLQMG